MVAVPDPLATWTVKVAEELPAVTFTEDGIVTATPELVVVMARPPEGALPVNETVQVEEAGAVRVLGLQARVES